MEATEDDRFARELAEAYETGMSEHYARVLSGRLRQMDKRAKAANVRADQLQAALAAERQAATLNAETHTRQIRALEDMVEAEAEARREAEEECRRLKAILLLQGWINEDVTNPSVNPAERDFPKPPAPCRSET